jgi:hypothetical protein
VAAALAGAAGALAVFVPEPTFFLLAPLVAAGLAWPLRHANDEPEGIPRALPGWAVPVLSAPAPRTWGSSTRRTG